MRISSVLIMVGLGVVVVGVLLRYFPFLFSWFGNLPGDIKRQSGYSPIRGEKEWLRFLPQERSDVAGGRPKGRRGSSPYRGRKKPPPPYGGRNGVPTPILREATARLADDRS
jgi:hypothetical protein